MKEQDILLFPSLFEGFGLVITESMSQGTPVITTERTAGPDIITNGEDSWIVKAGSSDGLKEKIEEILLNRELVKIVGQEAMETAKKRPWSVFGEELTTKINLINAD